MNLSRNKASSRIELSLRFAGGDAPTPTAGESTAEMMQAFIKSFPQLLDVVIPGMSQTAKGNLAAAQATAPGFAQLQTDILKGPGSELSQAADNLAAQQAVRQAESDSNVVGGAGRELVQKAFDTSQIFDRPFYDVRDTMAGKYNELLGGIDPNRLTGGERSEVERGLARESAKRGTSNSPSAIETLGAANTYGSALNAKRSVLNQALQTANQFLAPSKSGVDTFAVATGRPVQNNLANAGFQPVNQGSGNNALDVSGNLLNQVGALTSQANTLNSQRRDSLDRVNETMGSIPSYS